MKKLIILINIICSFLILKGQSDNITINKLILQEDENLKITLIYFSKADIGDADWLKIEIENKTEYEIQIIDVNYHVNKEYQSDNGKKYVDIGEFGQGNEYDLIHYFYDLPNASDYRDSAIINPKSSIFAWKYLTNYASVLIDSRSSYEKKVNALFQLDFKYKLNGNYIKLTCNNKPFCFEWVNSESVPIKKLETRLREIVFTPHYRWVNTYITSNLMNKDYVVKNISTKDLIQGVLLREDVMNEDENILFLTEIKKRNASPNKKLTKSFRKRITENNNNVSGELQYYWDNKLLDDLLNSELHWRQIQRILEIHSKSWSSNTNNTKKVYDYLATALYFEKTENLQTEEIKKWADNVKLISTSRNYDFIKYLEKYLDDETEFCIEDWTIYPRYYTLSENDKPAILTIRICDIAFIALLRALNQFEYKVSSKIGTKYYSLMLSDEILSSEVINSLMKKSFQRNGFLKTGILIELLDKEIKLSPESKKKIKDKIKTVAPKRSE